MRFQCGHCDKNHVLEDRRVRGKSFKCRCEACGAFNTVGASGLLETELAGELILATIRPADFADDTQTENAPQVANGGAASPSKEMLEKWADLARLRYHGHVVAGRRLQHLHYILGIPVVILSSVVGTTVFASLEKDALGTYTKVGVATVSIAAAVMASLQTFLGLAQKAERHFSFAGRFASTRRNIEQALSDPGQSGGKFRETVTELSRKLDGLQVEEPSLSREDLIRARNESSAFVDLRAARSSDGADAWWRK